MKQDPLKQVSWWPLVAYVTLLVAHAWTYLKYRSQYEWLMNWGFVVAVAALIMAGLELSRPVGTRLYEIYEESLADITNWLKPWALFTVLLLLVGALWAWHHYVKWGWALGAGAASVLLFWVEAWLLIWSLENTDQSRVQGCPPATPPR